MRVKGTGYLLETQVTIDCNNHVNSPLLHKFCKWLRNESVFI